MTTSEAVASIDFLSSIPEDILDASGPLGRTYNLQLQRQRAERNLDFQRELVHEEIAREERQRAIGSLTPAHERVERDPEVIKARLHLDYLTEAVTDAQRKVGGIVFLPAVDNIAEIEKRLASLNKKAAKLSTEPITLTVSKETLVLNYKTNDEDTRGYDFAHVFAVLKGATPKVPGFEFLATVTHTDAGNVIKRIPAIAYGIRHNLNFDMGHTDEGRKISDSESAAGKALEAIDLSKYRDTGNLCEQCGLHRDRLDTFIVYNEQTGETKQVGRNCLRDYTGLNNPEQVLKVLEQVWEFIRSIGARSEKPVIPTNIFLIHCAAVMRAQGGYVKGLGHDAVNNLFDKINNRRDQKTGLPVWVEPNEIDEHNAAEILRWVRGWDEESEFAYNVKTSLANDYVPDKLYGLGGAAFIAHENWLGRERIRKANAERNGDKGHIGTEGQRETFTLTITGIKWIADRYGYGDDATKPLIIMVDPDGNEVKWFASDLPAVADQTQNNWPKEGGTYQVKATVKRHEEDERYGKSTVVNRCKFEKTISEPDDAS